MAISLVACKSGEVTNEVKTVVVRMMCDTLGCKGEMKPTGVCLTTYPAQWPHACTVCKVGRTYRIVYPDKRFETVADKNKLTEGFIPYFTIETNIMSKDVLLIQPSIATNWQSIGTYTPKTGASEDVQRGNIVTNTTAILEWKGKRHELLLESVNGPECGERRVPMQNQWPQQWYGLGWMGTNITITNILLNDLIPHEQQGFTITNSVWIDHIEGTNIGPWIQVMTNSNHNYNLETKW